MGTDIVMEYSDVFVEDKGALLKGKIKFTDKGIGFKHSKTSQVDHVDVSEIKEVGWIRLANQAGIRVRKNDERSVRYGGFNDEDREKIRGFAKNNWKLDLEEVDMCVKGWNYGKHKFDGASMKFDVDDKQCFEVPLSNVSNCSGQKNEVVMEFHPNENCPVSLMEMRFHMPYDAESSVNADVNPVEEFRQAVLKYAGIVEDSDKAPVVIFDQIMFNTPRGRYDIKVFSTSLALHGKTFDYKIPISSVLRMFYLAHKDGIRSYFVVSLDPPLRQGQTRYPFLVLEFSLEDESSIELNLTDEQLAEKYEGKLQREMTGKSYELFCRVMRMVLKQKITVPGTYIGKSGTPAIECACKHASGFLYPLEKGFIFVPKPPIHIKFEDVANVYFGRSELNTRSFDFDIETKQQQVYAFSGIEKDEYEKLYDFVNKKGCKIRNAGKNIKLGKEESDDEPDSYAARLKHAANEESDGNPNDSSDEDDEDYNPEEEEKKRKAAKEAKGSDPSSDGTGSASEPELEYDSGSGASENDHTASKTKTNKRGSKERKSGGKRERKASGNAKSKKDPNAPKRPMSAYFLWMNANRENIKEGGMSVAEVGKKAGELWGKLEDKSEWEQKAQEDKQRYADEMESYQKSNSSKSNSPSNPKKSSPVKGSFKSKEYVEDSDDSNASNPPEKSKAGKKKSPPKSKSSDELSDDEGEESSGDDRKAKPKKSSKNKKASSSNSESSSESDSD